MSPPFDLLNMVAVGAQTDVAGVAIARNDAARRVVEIRHLVMWIEPTGDEFEALATFGQPENLVEHVGVVEWLAFTTDGDALDLWGIDQPGEVFPRQR
ncbi:hypothetical protein D9M68_762110 [compost metagenome]